MSKILIINGPNLNFLGTREQDIYGQKTFDEFFEELCEVYPQYDISLFQSNIEGEIINALHSVIETNTCVILNAAGYTHTSVSIADAVGVLKSHQITVVEVHISNIIAREEFRHKSLIAPKCSGTITGFGLDSYKLAVEYIKINDLH